MERTHSSTSYNRKLKNRSCKKKKSNVKNVVKRDDKKSSKIYKKTAKKYDDIFSKHEDISRQKKFFIKPEEHLWHVPSLCDKDHERGKESEYILHSRSYLEYYKEYMSYVKAFNKVALDSLTKKKDK